MWSFAVTYLLEDADNECSLLSANTTQGGRTLGETYTYGFVAAGRAHLLHAEMRCYVCSGCGGLPASHATQLRHHISCRVVSEPDLPCRFVKPCHVMSCLIMPLGKGRAATQRSSQACAQEAPTDRPVRRWVAGGVLPGLDLIRCRRAGYRTAVWTFCVACLAGLGSCEHWLSTL